MNALEIASGYGLFLMFLLGLRHGLDPDHIACIDGMTWRSLEGDRALAPWVGTLFAAGHGLLVTAIAVGVSGISQSLALPERLVDVFEWLPTLLLLLVGTLNLRQLLHPTGHFHPTGWKLGLIPRRLRDQGSPWAIFLVGVLFAAVFDTATQASAWGYVAASSGGTPAALAAGLAFTAGMVITDSLDSRLLCHIIGRRGGAELARRYRRALGWLIVALSFGVAGYNLLRHFLPAAELGDTAWSMVGLSLLLALMLVWALPALQRRR